MRTGSSRAWTSPTLLAVVLCTLGVVALPGRLAASNYTGYGDTGFAHTSKAKCCEDAVFIAQDNSAADCERAGGYPDFRRTSARGRCNWETRRGNGRTVYRCTATSSVYCR
jgi:hypothetical protein